MKTIRITITSLTLAMVLGVTAAAASPFVGTVYEELDLRINDVNPIATSITDLIIERYAREDTLVLAEAIIAFVQALVYIAEETDRTIPAVYCGRWDWWQTPDETLLKGGGDCEDLAMLCYFMLREAGVPAAVVEMSGHMAVAVKVPAWGDYFAMEDGDYFYVECTAPWPIGTGGYGYAWYALYQL